MDAFIVATGIRGYPQLLILGYCLKNKVLYLSLPVVLQFRQSYEKDKKRVR